VFLLEMGEQVRIIDLARQLVRLAGLREGEDIEIIFTGLRPGEKLYEELHSDTERTRMTRHERIIKWELDVCDEDQLLRDVTELERRARGGDAVAIRQALIKLVPEFAEAPIVPMTEAPDTPVVELPAASTPLARPTRDWGQAARATVDAAVAMAVLALSAPIWAMLWIEARRRGERNVLVYEARVGRTRRHLQRRSLTRSAAIDRRASERRTQDLHGQPLRCARFRSDLGPVSRWVTHRRLDKLPFLINVMRGEMTLVGPKPEREDLVLRWHHVVPEYSRRFSVLPGVTGLAQVWDCVDSDADGIVRRVHYDLFYIDNRSLLLDVRTLGRTLGVLARRPRGSMAQPPGAPAREPVVKGVTR
jgi:lipopolysaccharide/colanic/teichoic acid biosynthesis glycosyltransferase